MQVELHISKLYPALFAHELGDEQREGGGQDDVQKQYLEKHAALPAIAAQVPNWPTRPEVPMPAEAEVFFI